MASRKLIPYVDLVDIECDPDNVDSASVGRMAGDLLWLREKTIGLWTAIKHGDEEHQQWLKEAIEAHFDGRSLPEVK